VHLRPVAAIGAAACEPRGRQTRHTRLPERAVAAYSLGAPLGAWRGGAGRGGAAPLEPWGFGGWAGLPRWRRAAAQLGPGQARPGQARPLRGAPANSGVGSPPHSGARLSLSLGGPPRGRGAALAPCCSVGLLLLIPALFSVIISMLNEKEQQQSQTDRC
jgi:hypothetical protein